MDVESTVLGLANSATAQMLLKLALAQVAPVASTAAATEVAKLLTEADAGVDAARSALDKLETANPRVMQAVSAIQGACSGIVVIPTEDQAIGLIHHMLDAARSYLPTLLPASAG